MGRHSEAVDQFVQAERSRAYDVGRDETVAKALRQAAHRALGFEPSGIEPTVRFRAPYTLELAVPPDWHTAGFVTEARDDTEDVTIYLRLTGTTETPEVEAYAVGTCPRCDANVPLGPSLPSDLPPYPALAELGAVLRYGTPVEAHYCPALVHGVGQS